MTVKIGDKVKGAYKDRHGATIRREGVICMVFDWGVKLCPKVELNGETWQYNLSNEEIEEVNGIKVCLKN